MNDALRGVLLGHEDAVELETFEDGLVERVDGAGVDVFDARLLEQGDGFYRGAEVLADAHHHQVTVLVWQHIECRRLSRVDTINRGKGVFHLVDARLVAVDAYHLVPHVLEVAGEVLAINAESDNQVSHIVFFEFVFLLSVFS